MSHSLRRTVSVALGSLVLPLVAFVGTPDPAAARPAATAAPASEGLWSPSSQRPSSQGGKTRTVSPKDYRAYTLDGAGLAQALARAPLAGTQAARGGGAVEVVVPAPTGEPPTFAVVESPTMQKRLQAQHPDIRTYVGNEAATGDSISLVVTPSGVHASVRGDHPSWYVDPAYQNDDSLYLSYFGQALPEPEKAFVEPKLSKATESKITEGAPSRIGEGPDGLVNQRVYRLAFLTDNSYAEYVAPGLNDGTQDAQSNTAVLAAKTLLMARVNQVYNDDLAVRMILINDTDKLNLNTAAKMTGAGGPCGTAPCYTTAQAAGCTGGTLTRNRYVVGLLAGAENFDIGHIGFGLNGGGVASLGASVLTAKAQGCTGLPQPIGDFYAIDYVAHEMGHQFNGPHTFNGTVANCSTGNRTAGSSVEPGSGSSVMAYAGICGSDDLQPHTDPYFSQRSQTDIGGLLLATPINLNESADGRSQRLRRHRVLHADLRLRHDPADHRHLRCRRGATPTRQPASRRPSRPSRRHRHGDRLCATGSPDDHWFPFSFAAPLPASTSPTRCSTRSRRRGSPTTREGRCHHQRRLTSPRPPTTTRQ